MKSPLEIQWIATPLLVLLATLTPVAHCSAATASPTAALAGQSPAEPAPSEAGIFHGGMPPRGPALRAMRHRGLAMRLAELDLSDAQREKLRDLHEAQARKNIQRHADMQLARMDLRQLMRADKVDAAAVNAQIDRLARMRADAMKAAFATRLEARAVLTPEQWKKLHNEPGSMREHEMMDGVPRAPRR